MAKCPTCGQKLPDNKFHIDAENQVIMRGGIGVVLTPHQMKIIQALWDGHPGWVSSLTVRDAVHGEKSNEAGKEKSTMVQVSRLRKVLAPLSMGINWKYRTGYKLEFYNVASDSTA